MKKILIAIFGILLVFPAFSSNQQVQAVPMGGYSIQKVDSPSQVGTADFFNLLLQPGQKETIYLDIENSSDKAATFELKVNPAFTSDAGATDYSKNKGKLDKSMPFDLRKVAVAQQTEIPVGANSTKRVGIDISMPSSSFKGRVLGGINVTKKTKDPNTKTKTDAQIQTKISYTLGLVLQNDLEKVTPDLKYIKTEPAAFNATAVIQMKFQNPTPTIIPNLIFTTTVKKDGKKYIQNTSSRYQVAPNTNFHVNLGLDGERVEPGDYSVKVVARSGKFYKWEFSDKFTIKPAKAEEVNKNSIFPQKKGINIWIIITIILAAILLGFILFLLWKRKKENEEKQDN